MVPGLNPGKRIRRTRSSQARATEHGDVPDNVSYYKSCDDQTIRMVDLRKPDLSAKEVKQLDPTGTRQSIVDM
jgi:hypothetical protein